MITKFGNLRMDSFYMLITNTATELNFDNISGTVKLENVKVKLSLCLTKYHSMRTYGEVEVQRHAFLTSALYRCEWSHLHPSHFTPEKSQFGRCDEGKKIPRTAGNRTPLVQPVA
jgi:hypothetical protein